MSICYLVFPSLHRSEGEQAGGEGKFRTGQPPPFHVREPNIKQVQSISSLRQQTAQRLRNGVLICILTGLACTQLGTVSCSVVSILLTPFPPSWQPSQICPPAASEVHD